MTPTLVFDIETIPDIAGLRVLHGLDEQVSDAEVAEMAFQQRRQLTGTDFMQHHLQRVVAISCVLREGDNFKVWSLGTPGDDEASLIQDFFDCIDRYTPQLVSWNGGGFDLPVLNYRALVGGVKSQVYWDTGEENRDFKWNNYLSRYHTRHLDLMDMLALYTGRANAPLNDMARLVGLPGKLGMDGGAVWSTHQNGGIDSIRNYCETDALNTYLLYARFEMMRGHLSADAYRRECERVRTELALLGQPHWGEFLAAWR